MEIIEIQKYNEIKGIVHGYCACASVEQAVSEHIEKHGVVPDVAYVKRTPSGRCTVYLKTEERRND